MPHHSLSESLDGDIAAAHERFVAAMESRLPGMSPGAKERYCAIVSSLADKLEEPAKSLRAVAREMVTEAMGTILREIARRD